MRISDWSSDVCSSDLHDAVGQSIVVGVGYPTDQPYAAQRAEDFIVMDNPPPGTRLGRTAGRSGRDEFLDFLTGKLRAEIGKRYRIDPDSQALFGHSFAGLFPLPALYSEPQARSEGRRAGKEWVPTVRSLCGPED